MSLPPVAIASKVRSRSRWVSVKSASRSRPQRAMILCTVSGRSSAPRSNSRRFRDNAYATKLGHLIRERAQAFEKRQPAGVRVRVAYDQPEWVARNLGNFMESLFEGILLVMGVVTLGLGLRAAAVVAVAIALSIGGALVGLFSLGFALEQVSTAGLIVALGLLVDDAVVVTESIQLLRDRGLSAWRAAILGTARVFWANNVTTAVACASFLPFFFMGGDIGKFILGLPTAVVLALATSLVVAQVVTPWLSLKMIRQHSKAPPVADNEAFHAALDVGDDAHHERNWLFRPVKWAYSRVSPFIVRRPWAVLALWLAMLGAALSLFPKIGLQFFPKADKPLLFVRVEMPRGTRIDVTAGAVSRVVKAIRQQPIVYGTSGVIGFCYPTIFIGSGTPWFSSDIGDVLVRTAPGVASKDAARAVEKVLADFAGIRTHVEELYTGPPVLHPIMIRVTGDDYESLRVYAERIKALLREQPGTRDVRDNLSETVPVSRVQLDADRALRFGVTSAQVAGTLRWLYGEDKIWELREDRDTKQVVLKNAPISGEALVDLEQARIPTAVGNSIPLFSVAHVEQTQTYAELHRRNSRRTVEITSDLVGNTLAANIVGAMRSKLDKYDWKPGYGYWFAGQNREQLRKTRAGGDIRVNRDCSIAAVVVQQLPPYADYRMCRAFRADWCVAGACFHG